MANRLTSSGLVINHTYGQNSVPSAPNVGAIWSYMRLSSAGSKAVLPSGGAYLYIDGHAANEQKSTAISGGTTLDNTVANFTWLRLS